jgi:hypothetical protein
MQPMTENVTDEQLMTNPTWRLPPRITDERRFRLTPDSQDSYSAQMYRVPTLR